MRSLVILSLLVARLSSGVQLQSMCVPELEQLESSLPEIDKERVKLWNKEWQQLVKEADLTQIRYNKALPTNFKSDDDKVEWHDNSLHSQFYEKMCDMTSWPEVAKICEVFMKDFFCSSRWEKSGKWKMLCSHDARNEAICPWDDLADCVYDGERFTASMDVDASLCPFLEAERKEKAECDQVLKDKGMKLSDLSTTMKSWIKDYDEEFAHLASAVVNPKVMPNMEKFLGDSHLLTHILNSRANIDQFCEPFLPCRKQFNRYNVEWKNNLVVQLYCYGGGTDGLSKVDGPIKGFQEKSPMD